MPSEKQPQISRLGFLELCMVGMGSLAMRSFPASIREIGNIPPAESKLPELLQDKTIEIEGKFAPNKPITIYDFPLRKDFTFDPEQKISVYEMPASTCLLFRNMYFLKDISLRADQQIRRLTILPNTMGSNNLMVAELDRGSFDTRGKYLPLGTEHPGLNRPTDNILGDISYMVGDERIYPNKILNLLNSMAYILDYQEKSGPFRKDQIYSYIQLINLAHGKDYLPGYTSSLDVVSGGGVCAGATTVANAFWGAAKSLGIDYDKTFLDPKYNHPTRYKLGPFGPDTFITDTTIQINPDGSKFDYNFIPPCDLYLNIRAAVIPNGVDFSETHPQGLRVVDDQGSWARSDAQFILNVSLIKNIPQTKADDIRMIRQGYIDFRNSKHLSGTPAMNSKCWFTGNFDWKVNSKENFGPQIYPEENTRLFNREITKSEYLQDIFALQGILNSIDEADTGKIARIVRRSEWYLNKAAAGKTDQALESSISQLDYVHIPGEPVQCIAWATLIAGLSFPNAPLNIGSVPIGGPIELIPNSILTHPYRQTAHSPTGGKLIADRDIKISEINPGDLFLMRSSSSFGHVGVILDRKNTGGKDYLLATESNRHRDGKIQIYTVDEYNFNAKLGMPPEKKILLRKY